RIDHARVEPQGVELVGNVVVVADRVAIHALGVARAVTPDVVEPPIGGARDLLEGADRLAHVALELRLALDVRLRKAEGAPPGDRGRGLERVQAQRHLGRVGKRHLTAVPEDDAYWGLDMLLEARKRVVDGTLPEHGYSSHAPPKGADDHSLVLAQSVCVGREDCSAPASNPSTFLRSSRPCSLSLSWTPMPWGRFPAVWTGLIQATFPWTGIFAGSSRSVRRRRTSSPRAWGLLLGTTI